MAGLVCLQGGGELTPACNEMDEALLERCSGPVAVLPLAATSGEAYGRTCAQGVSHFRRLGAEAYEVPNPRGGEADVTDVLQEAGLVVLPGGSPSQLLRELQRTGLDDVLRAHVAAGRAVMGASAGAMVLGSLLLLPDSGMRVEEGLGIAPGVVVVPHWDGRRKDWLKALSDAEGVLLGLPEESGVLLEDGRMTAVGARNVRVIREGTDLSVGASRPAP